mgnify:CR=1 FL=1
MPTPLILGSSSRYRATALRTLGLEFQQLSPDVDESPRKGEQPNALALRLAQDKARYLAQRHPGAVVIGSDQVGSCEQRLLTKPGTQANAIRSHYSNAAVNSRHFTPRLHLLDRHLMEKSKSPATSA